MDAHVRAAEVGEPGRRYVISAVSLEVPEAIALLERVAGVRIEPRLVPRSIVRRVGLPLSFLLRHVPAGVRLCPDMVRVLLHGHRYDGSAAEHALGLTYTPVEETLRATVQWYRDQGLIGAGGAA